MVIKDLKVTDYWLNKTFNTFFEVDQQWVELLSNSNE